MKRFVTIKLHDLSNVLTARLSRHIVLWIFASFFLVEAILLIPSLKRREQEVLHQIQDVSSGKVFWIATTYPNLSAREFLNWVRELQQDPMLEIKGGAVYQSTGQLVGTFGETPQLTYADVMANNPMNFEATESARRWGDRYDAAWLIPYTGGHHVLVIRHNASRVRSNMYAFLLRDIGNVLLLSAVLTVTILTVLAIAVITPVLRLREDLIAAGDAIAHDESIPLFYSASVNRRDELGDVIAAFQQMFKQIWQAMTERKQAEQALAQANQEIMVLNQKLTVENLRMSAELTVSRKLQHMLLPREQELRQISGLDIAGFMEPATEVGGDYYDVLSHGGRVKIGIGDVTGHGLESGVLMLMTQTATRTLLNANQTDPVQFLNTLNQTIYDNVQRMDCDKSMTLTLLDYQDGTVCLSGQHEAVILVRQNGDVECIDTLDLGFPLGLEKDITRFVTHIQFQLDTGDGIVLYTDGITEAQNLQRECYGLERLCAVVKQHWARSVQDIQQAVIRDVQQFVDGQEFQDDLTLVVLKQQ